MGDAHAATVARVEVLDLLDRAVVKGLVVIEGGRYRLIDSVRAYAREVTDREEDAKARTAHFIYFAALAEDTERKVRGPDQRKWLAVFDEEQENLRRALDWGFANPTHYHQALEMLYNITPYDFIKGAFRELLHRYELALQIDAHIDDDLRSRLFRRAGLMAMNSHDPRAITWYGTALELAKKSGNPTTLADAVFTYGNYLLLNDDMAGAEPYLRDSLIKFKNLGDVYGEGFAYITLANLSSFQRRDDEARELYEESLRVRKQVGDLRGIGASLSALASLAMKQGNLKDACPLIREGLSLFIEVGTPVDFADSLPRAAWYAAVTGHAKEAGQLIGFSDASSQRMRGRRDRTDQGDYDNAERASREALGIGNYESVWRSGKSLTIAEAYELALRVLL